MKENEFGNMDKYAIITDFTVMLDCEPERVAGITTADGIVNYYSSRECYDYLAETALDSEVVLTYDEHVELIGLVRNFLLYEARSFLNYENNSLS